MLFNFFLRRESPAPVRRRAQERPSRSREPLKSLHKHRLKKSIIKLESGCNHRQKSEQFLRTELTLFNHAIILAFLKKSLVVLGILVLQKILLRGDHQTVIEWIVLGLVYLASQQVLTTPYKDTIRMGLSICLWLLYPIIFYDTIRHLTSPITATIFVVLHQMCLQWYKPVWSIRSQKWLAVSLINKGESKAQYIMLSCCSQIKGKLICLQKLIALDTAILLCMTHILWEILYCASVFALFEGYFLILNLIDHLILSQINSLHGQSYVSSALLRLNTQEQTHSIQKECLKSIGSIVHQSQFHMSIFTKRFRAYLNKQLRTIYECVLHLKERNFPERQTLRAMRMMNELSVSIVISNAMSELSLGHNFEESAQTAQKIEKLLGEIASSREMEWGIYSLRESLSDMIRKVNN